MSDVLDGEVSPWERLAIRLHLMMCKPCAAMERSLKRTVESLRMLTDMPAPADQAPGRDRGTQ